MLTIVIGWVKGLSLVGKTSLVLVMMSTAGAVVSANTPRVSHILNNENVKSVETVKKTSETIYEYETIFYRKQTVDDPSLEKGKTRIVQNGVNGERTKTYLITSEDGKESMRALVNDEITEDAIDEITALGTYEPPVQQASCDSNYTGACVPIASDVDCGSGDGNGPAYVYSRVIVVGSDIYGLDRDGDGIGCENG